MFLWYFCVLFIYVIDKDINYFKISDSESTFKLSYFDLYKNLFFTHYFTDRFLDKKSKIEKFHGLKSELPEGYTPKIKIKAFFPKSMKHFLFYIFF